MNSQAIENVPVSGGRLPYIDQLRILAVLLVGICHLCDIEAKYDPSPILPERLNWGVFGTDMFFVLSGFLIVRITKQRAGPFRPVRFLADRAARLYPLYWFVTTLLVVLVSVRPDWVFSSTAGVQPNLLTSFLLWPTAQPPLHAVGWSLIHILVFYLYFAIAAYVSGKDKLLRALIIWAVLLAGAQTLILLFLGPITQAERPLLSALTHPYSWSFLFGALAATVRCPPNLAKLAIASGGAITLFSLFGLQYVSDFHLRLDPWARVFLRAAPFAILVWGAATFKSARVTWPYQRQMADSAYAFFLFHILVFSAIGRAWAPFASTAYWDNLLIFGIMFGTTVIASRLAYLWIERPVCNYIRALYRTDTIHQKAL